MDSRWLQAQFKINPEKTKADLARDLGLEPSAISKILASQRQIKAHEYVIMRRFFGLPTDERATGASLPHKPLLAPLGGNHKLSDSARYVADNESEWVIPAPVLALHTAATSDKIRVYEVQEGTMEPDFRKGEHVLINLADTTPSPPGSFVLSDGFGHIIRDCAFIPHSNPPQISVSARVSGFTTQTVPLSAADIVGRIIAKLQWL